MKLLQSNKKNNIIKYIYFKILKPKISFCNKDLSAYYIYKNAETPFKNYTTQQFDPIINKVFNQFTTTVEVEYIIDFKKTVIIEPYIGWCLNSNYQIIKESLPYSDASVPIPHFIYYKRKNIVSIKEGIYIRYNWYNYWHFMNDIMGQFQMIETHKLDRDIPIIMPKKALKLDYVKEFLQTAFAKSKTWIMHEEGTYLQVENIIFCKGLPNTGKTLLYGATIFKNHYKIPTSKFGQNIFINRNPKRGRNISNINEILCVLKQFNFDIVDNDDLSLDQQIALFQNASNVVGIHGAGLVNMIYSYPRKIKILELFPYHKTPVHYFWQAHELNFQYDCIIGKEDSNDSFTICVNEFKEKIENLLK